MDNPGDGQAEAREDARADLTSMADPGASDAPTPAQVAAAMWAMDRASQSAGLVLGSVESGHATLSLVVTDQHVNGLGVCHGGFIFLLADSAMAFASNSHNQLAVAANAQIEFLRPAKQGDVLVAVAIDRQLTRRTGVHDVEVRLAQDGSAAAGTLIALMRGRTSKVGGELIPAPTQS